MSATAAEAEVGAGMAVEVVAVVQEAVAAATSEGFWYCVSSVNHWLRELAYWEPAAILAVPCQRLADSAW